MNGTKQLRRIIEQESQDVPNLTAKQRIEVGRLALFGDMDYPIFDEAYRPVFETHFIRHFYFREIGFETEGMFKFYLETWLNINMPYYNKLFESELIKYDPLMNTKIEIVSNKKKEAEKEGEQKDSAVSDGTFNQNSTGNRDALNYATGKTANEGFQRDLFSETPQDRLQLTTEDGKGVIEYATNIEEKRNTATSNTNSQANVQENTKDRLDSTARQNTDRDQTNRESGKEMEDFVYEKVGKIGVTNYSKMLQDFRQTFLRIENALFKECSELFLQIWL